MNDKTCSRCGSGGLAAGFICVRCPICGDVSYMPEAVPGLMWSEHRLGLMYAAGGWKWLGVFEPPAWFFEEVI